MTDAEPLVEGSQVIVRLVKGHVVGLTYCMSVVADDGDHLVVEGRTQRRAIATWNMSCCRRVTGSRSTTGGGGGTP